MDPMRQRDMMGYAWQEKKQKEKLKKERDEFNRQQAEAEQQAAMQREQELRRAPSDDRSSGGQALRLGDDAWVPRNESLPTADTRMVARGRSNASAGQGGAAGEWRRALGQMALAVAVISGGLALLAFFDGGDNAESAFLLFWVVFILAVAGYRAARTGGGSGGTAVRGGSGGTAVRGGSGGTAVSSGSAGTGVSGEARGIQRRMELAGKTNIEVLTFRVERYDASGNRLGPVAVEMRGGRFEGSLQEGDHVRVPGKTKRGQSLQASMVENLTTKTVLRVRRPKRAKKFVWDIIWIAIVVGLILFFLASSANAIQGWF